MRGRHRNKIGLRGNTFIVGEGFTEQFYFTHLKHLRKYNCVVKPRFFGKTSISDIEKSVKKLLLGGVTVICVFDTDVSVRDQAENEKLKQFRKKYVNNRQVILCESYPSIEFWFLLHHIKTTRCYMNAGEVLTGLKKYMPGFSKEVTFLEKQKWVEELCSGNRLETATQRASEILAEKAASPGNDHFPYTKVGDGIEWFEKTKNKGVSEDNYGVVNK